MLSISKMRIEDLNEIKDKLSEEFDDFWNENILKQELSNENSNYVVARENNEIVGFGGIWTSPDDVHITDIVTRKMYRSKGIGSRILEELINLAKTKNKASLTLEVNEKNTIAQKLYEKYGFKMLGRRKKYYNNTDDAIIMTLYFEK